MRSLGFEPRKEEIRRIAKEVDPSNSGKVADADFVRVMGSKLVDKSSSEEIMKAFRLFDDDGTGRISFSNLKRVAQELGEAISDSELQVSQLLRLSYEAKLFVYLRAIAD
jgi:Ca2+-binding EF-hand superfamily protein